MKNEENRLGIVSSLDNLGSSLFISQSSHAIVFNYIVVIKNSASAVPIKATGSYILFFKAYFLRGMVQLAGKKLQTFLHHFSSRDLKEETGRYVQNNLEDSTCFITKISKDGGHNLIKNVS